MRAPSLKPETRNLIENKMLAAGIAHPVIQAFLGAAAKVASGERGLIAESEIESVSGLPSLESLPSRGSQAGELLNHLAVIKLNGGLGTSMGLERAKSLIPVKNGETFMDFIAKQILRLRSAAGAPQLAFFLMDSFSTQTDTLAYLKKYPALAAGGELDFLQSKVPKLDRHTLAPIDWPSQPELEWCPPGHGDLYPSLMGCGLLDEMLSRGIRFLFVSNADNLGATVDVRLLDYFAESGHSFLMEVARRTPADRKGGHLARRRADGRLLLREAAQCPGADEREFQNIERHGYFNTNNLWIRLDQLKSGMEAQGGVLPLALITNEKTVDPRNPASPKVFQIESAMGAAIESFARSGAIVVPRSRFAPVKTTSDLLVLRSDAYRVTEDFQLVLDDSRQSRPPIVDLDTKHYKILADFEAAFAKGTPSLLRCDSLKVTGKLRFAAGIECRGAVEFIQATLEERTVQPGTYSNGRFRI